MGALFWEALDGRRHPDWGKAIIFTPNGRGVVSLSYDWTLKVWDLNTHSCITTWEGEPGHYKVALSADSRWAAIGHEEFGNSIIDVATGQSIATWKTGGRIMALYASSEGSLIVWETHGNLLKGWHVQTERYVSALEGHTKAINCVAISLDGTCIVSGEEDGMLRIWETTYSQ